jgi:protein SEY1
MSRKFVHLIDDNGQFADGLQVLMDDDYETQTVSSSSSSLIDPSRISSTGTDYAIVGILGPQSSGKSTLLNHLFHTQFPTLLASGVRQQTTKGIYAAFDPDDHILILDLEGNDGVERAVSEKENLEKKLGLFSLCLSEILMINLWFHDIGRYSAANLGLLKVIFELHMQLKQGSKSLLLFVIRDQVEEQTPLSVLATQLQKDVQQIWDESIKTFHPDAVVQTRLEDVFDCQFFGMPHYQFQNELFLEKVDGLRTMINRSRKPEYQKNVPILDLHEYASKLWVRDDLTSLAHTYTHIHTRVRVSLNCMEWSGLKFGSGND